MDHMIWSCDLTILWITITRQSSTRGVHNGKVAVRDRWEITIRGSMAMGRWGDNDKGKAMGRWGDNDKGKHAGGEITIRGSTVMGRHWDSKARGELNYY